MRCQMVRCVDTVWRRTEGLHFCRTVSLGPMAQLSMALGVLFQGQLSE